MNLEVAADRDGLSTMAAVVEFEYRNSVKAVALLHELGRPVGAGRDLGSLTRNVEALLGEVEIDAPRIRSAGVGVEFHVGARAGCDVAVAMPRTQVVLPVLAVAPPILVFRRTGPRWRTPPSPK